MKEKLEERKRTFVIDKKIYNKKKDQIKSDKDIPELFKIQYPIFKKMEEQNILGTENDFDFYNKEYPKTIVLGTSKYRNIFGDYTPHTFLTSSDSESSSDESTSENSSESSENDLIDVEISEKMNDSDSESNNEEIDTENY